MTEQQQKIALCEWWKPERYNLELDQKKFQTVDMAYLLHWWPDTNSLDVLHEMEKRLTDSHKTQYAHNLARLILVDDEVDYPEGQAPDLVEDFCVLHATAAQRREALLKTLGLWKEELNAPGGGV